MVHWSVDADSVGLHLHMQIHQTCEQAEVAGTPSISCRESPPVFLSRRPILFIRMAEVQPSLNSISGVVALGLQLSTSLHTYVEAVLEAKDRLRDVAIDISSTASTLKQLKALVDADANQTTKVFRDDGLNEVNSLSVSCGKAYSLIVVLLTKAGTPRARGKITAESIDPLELKTSVLTRHMRWHWLAPRIKRCQVQLRLFKTKLLLNLQLAQLAKVQLG